MNIWHVAVGYRFVDIRIWVRHGIWLSVGEAFGSGVSALIGKEEYTVRQTKCQSTLAYIRD